MKITDIKINPKNPRLIRDEKFKQLCKSITNAPWMMELRPIIINENGVIQGGNMRYRALVELGYKEIPDTWVKQADQISPEQWREFVVKDNLSYGEWELDLLAVDYNINELIEWGFDFPEFESPEEEAEAKDDNYEIPEEIETDIIEGDLFEIGNHRLICGDSTKTEAYERQHGRTP